MDEKTKLFLEKFKHLKELNEFNTMDYLYDKISHSNEAPWFSKREFISILSELVCRKLMIRRVGATNKNNELVIYSSLDEYYNSNTTLKGEWVFKMSIPVAEENW